MHISVSDFVEINSQIVGNGGTNSIGVLIEGFDNTLTNMRIANVFTGVLLKSQGNSMRNINPLYTLDYTKDFNQPFAPEVIRAILDK